MSQNWLQTLHTHTYTHNSLHPLETNHIPVPATHCNLSALHPKQPMNYLLTYDNMALGQISYSHL